MFTIRYMLNKHLYGNGSPFMPTQSYVSGPFMPTQSVYAQHSLGQKGMDCEQNIKEGANPKRRKNNVHFLNTNRKSERNCTFGIFSFETT